MRHYTKLSIAVGIVILSGCGGVKIHDPGKYGLFQKRFGSSSDQVVASREKKKGVIRPVPGKSPQGYVWPLKKGTVSSYFGKRDGRDHDGIDIVAPQGTPVFAVKSGKVVYSSNKIKGYGKMIVIKHRDGSASVYAHNRKNLVKRGAHVKQGRQIALVGRTGKATGPHLHFEIRKREAPRNPLRYLPTFDSTKAGKKVAKVRKKKKRNVQ